MLRVAERYAHGSLGLALIDFQRSGYMETWDSATLGRLHTSKQLADAWEECVFDPALAAALGGAADAARRHARPRGREVLRRARLRVPRSARQRAAAARATRLGARARRLRVDGRVRDRGVRVHLPANDDPRAFSLLAMIVSLFETGYLRQGRRTVRVRPRAPVARGHGGAPRRRDAPGRAVRRACRRPESHDARLVRRRGAVRLPTCAPSSASFPSRSARSHPGSVTAVGTRRHFAVSVRVRPQGRRRARAASTSRTAPGRSSEPAAAN